MLTDLITDCLIPDWPLPEGEARTAAVLRAADFVKFARKSAPFYISFPMQVGGLVLGCWVILLAPRALKRGGRYNKAAKAFEIFEKILPPCRAMVRLYRSTAFLAYFGDEAVLPALGAEAGTQRQQKFRAIRAALSDEKGERRAGT